MSKLPDYTPMKVRFYVLNYYEQITKHLLYSNKSIKQDTVDVDIFTQLNFHDSR